MIKTFTKDELDYLRDLVQDSKRSLDECCLDGIPIVDFISPDDAAYEYGLLKSLYKKLEVK